MTKPTLDTQEHANLLAEYNAVVSYHSALVATRFTIAGLLVAGSAFLVAPLLNPDYPDGLKAYGAAVAAWLTFCVWILELRTRSLYTNLALRGRQIEHEYWGLTGTNLYSGFFSRQHKIERSTGDPEKPNPDCPKVFGWQLPPWIGKVVTHSNGFDLLYVGTIILWSLFAISSAWSWQRDRAVTAEIGTLTADLIAIADDIDREIADTPETPTPTDLERFTQLRKRTQELAPRISEVAPRLKGDVGKRFREVEDRYLKKKDLMDAKHYELKKKIDELKAKEKGVVRPNRRCT